STRAIAFDSATHKREPFATFAPISFGPDKLTRIMLFATKLKLQAGEGTDVVSADAEDGSHRLYALTVEYVGPVPDQPWVTSVVVDREVNVLGVFRMTGASTTTMIRSVGAVGKGLEGAIVPSELAAISKAGTGALFSTSGNAFSTRTAGFIIQEHFPPGVDF